MPTMKTKPATFAPKRVRAPGPDDYVMTAINIKGPLAKRFRDAAHEYGMTHHGLAIQCIEFALSHMKGTTNAAS